MSNRASPFHSGEIQVQERLGVRDEVEAFAPRVIRDHLPDQHREFYQMLPFIMLGTVDEKGRPWASLVPGRPGFIESPDPGTLKFNATPLFGDPLHQTLKPGANVAALGIELETRRRNRITGQIKSVAEDSFTIAIGQAFGNCPQYIQTRAVDILPLPDRRKTEYPISRSDHFDPGTRALIEKSDTFFIATAFCEDHSAVSQGADVSHRGGRPGFIKVENDRSFTFPDFAGNNYFNTLGNINLNPKAGFLLIDFNAGDLVYMTGRAEIVWDGAEVQAFAGAERLIRFHAAEVIRIEGSLPLRFDFREYSPRLKHTGSWTDTAETIDAGK